MIYALDEVYKDTEGVVMQFMEALKLRSKLLLLFLLITIGLVSMGVIGTTNIGAMKKNIDSVYFGSLIPVTELNDILQTYHSGIESTLYRAKNSEISMQEASNTLEDSLVKVNNLWKMYEYHFKRDEELAYVEYVSLEIKVLNKYFYTILKKIRSGKSIDEISTISLEKYIFHINNVLEKLIKYEVDMAKYERKKFLQVYDEAVLRLEVMLSLIIVAVLIISYLVFTSIQRDHTSLELMTKKLKQANKKLESVSYTDTLTNMHNRRYFNMVYGRELKRAKRMNSYITFMMIDIDYFKQYNDRYGHLEGDKALKSVASVLMDTLRRPSDFVFRLGGEEFGVLFTQADESNSAKMAREIGNRVREKEIEHKNSAAGSCLTVSIGVVCCIADEALSEDMLLARADEMLYEAKATGRDRYIITSNVSKSRENNNLTA